MPFLRHSGSCFVIVFKQIKRFYANQSGMTLIDMAISLVVIGLLTIPLIKMYDTWKHAAAQSQTEANIGGINKAIADYYFINGYYPCPAPLNDAPGTAGYGRSVCGAGTVHTGAVPFVTLNIPTEMALDGWSNRIKYTVAASLSGPTTPASAFAGEPVTDISMLSFVPSEIDPVTGEIIECPGGELDPLPNVHFVLVSSGSMGAGGVSRDGVNVRACIDGDPTVESENCDNDAIFRANICARSNRNDATYYDDVVSHNAQTLQRMWVRSTADSTPAGKDPNDIVSTIQQIGINTPDAFSGTDQAGVDVVGNITTGTPAQPGAIISDTLCDENGENCFTPRLIGGPESITNDCRKNFSFGIRGIGNINDPGDNRNGSGARIRCQNTLTPSASNLCAPKYAIGFEGGKIKCAP